MFCVIAVIFFGFRFNDMIAYSKIYGQNINYSGLVKQMVVDKGLYGKGDIIFFNNDYYFPFTKYYFKSYNLISGEDIKINNNFFSEKNIKVLNSFRSVPTLNINGTRIMIFIIFNRSNSFYSELKRAVINYESDKGVEVKNVYYRLNCSTDNCSFYRTY
jgi:hypothetical protein